MTNITSDSKKNFFKDAISCYIKEIDRQYQTGLAREHSYRPALQELLAKILIDCTITNEPARSDCGAPDLIITNAKTQRPIFFVETKDLFDSDLDGRNKHKEQFERYRNSLNFIIFTDYLSFHAYEHGELITTITIGKEEQKHIKLIANAAEPFVELINHFAQSKPTPITSPAMLAKQMALKARMLGEIIKGSFKCAADENSEHFHENNQLAEQLAAFKKVLIHDLTPEQFADFYAQTIAYGMFAARLHDETPENFSRQEAATLIPKTNPFLRQIFQSIAGYDLDERLSWIVDDLVELFLATDMNAVMNSYKKDELHSDPMIHFYEDFLGEYDPALRKQKGVWYTPQPVVRFIVRAIDEILMRDFDLAQGLADSSKVSHKVINERYNGKKGSQQYLLKEEHRVQILDPATGTGTFLAEVARQIYSKFNGLEGMWQGYVQEHLIPRLHGFEILMASYAVAHLKLDMLLAEMGYKARESKERLSIYLTNSLEEYNPDTGTLFATWLSSEAQEANRIKRDAPIMVMLGNPPYSVSSSNKGEWINKLMADYKKDLREQNIQPLSDDYIKFLRLGQYYIEKNKSGILAFITNNSFIDGIIHRQMRKSLMETFDKIYIFDLHGNSRKKETAADGSKDENVFDIMQGVSINIFVKKDDNQHQCEIFHSELYGSRADKYAFLNEHNFSDIPWKKVESKEPQYFFVPKDFSRQEEYDKGFKIDELMQVNVAGIKTSNDKINVYDEKSELITLISDFNELDEKDFKIKYGLRSDSKDWSYINAKKDIVSLTTNKNIDLCKKLAYRPFDNKYCVYTGNVNGIMSRPRYNIMRHMLHDNIALNTIRVNRDYLFAIFVTSTITDKTLLSSKDDVNVFPLYLYPTADEAALGEEKKPNLDKTIWQKIDDLIGRPSTPEEIFAYIYAVLHSPSYREGYKEFLKIDFPRIPYPKNLAEFESLVKLGQRLIDIHLLRKANNWDLAVTYPATGDNRVEFLKFKDNCVYINKNQYFCNVPEIAWNFYIGGYQPAQKWLKDRKGRLLTFDDIQHYRKIIYALQATDAIMQEIDKVFNLP